MQDHRRLRVYHVAKELAQEVYAVAAALPPSERFELGRQLRRAAVSVGSDNAEGCGRSTARDVCAFLAMALGSAAELEFQLGHCSRVALAPDADIMKALETSKRVQRMLTSLILRIRTKDQRASPY